MARGGKEAVTAKQQSKKKRPDPPPSSNGSDSGDGSSSSDSENEPQSQRALTSGGGDTSGIDHANGGGDLSDASNGSSSSSKEEQQAEGSDEESCDDEPAPPPKRATKAAKKAAEASAKAEAAAAEELQARAARRKGLKRKLLSSANEGGGSEGEGQGGDAEGGDAAAQPAAAEAGGGASDDAGAKRKRKRVRKKKKGDEGGGDDGDGGGDGDGADVLTGSDTVYVEGIPYSAVEADVSAFFKGCGRVVSVRMPRYQDTGRPRGYAHVVFESAEAATKAFEKDGEYLQGRYLKIQQPQQPRALQAQAQASAAPCPPGCKTVFVKNLPYDANEEMVSRAFGACGDIAIVRLAIWNNTKQRKGFGYVDFTDASGAKAAVERQAAIRVGGRPVVVDYEVGRAKGSFRLSDGRKYEKVAREVTAPAAPTDGHTKRKHVPTAGLTGREWREAKFGRHKRAKGLL